MNRYLSSSVLGISGFIVLVANSALAEVKNCECEFKNRDYQAYGTNGACGVYMDDHAKTCEISFSGTGANSDILIQMLGAGSQQSQLDIAADVFGRYLEFLRTGDSGRLSEHEFIERSLPILARASLFRAELQKTEAPIKRLDILVQELAKKHSNGIELVFLGKKEPFNLKLDEETNADIGQGYVQINYKESVKLRVLYFSPMQR